MGPVKIFHKKIGDSQSWTRDRNPAGRHRLPNGRTKESLFVGHSWPQRLAGYICWTTWITADYSGKTGAFSKGRSQSLIFFQPRFK